MAYWVVLKAMKGFGKAERNIIAYLIMYFHGKKYLQILIRKIYEKTNLSFIFKKIKVIFVSLITLTKESILFQPTHCIGTLTYMNDTLTLAILHISYWHTQKAHYHTRMSDYPTKENFYLCALVWILCVCVIRCMLKFKKETT